MISLRNYIVEKLDEKILSLRIFEMAVDRKQFITKLIGQIDNIIINYILVKYCSTVDNYYDLRKHWCDELLAAYYNVYDHIIKGDHDKSIRTKAVKNTTYDFECFDENKIYSTIFRKIRSEKSNPNVTKHIDFDLDVIKKLCDNFAENYEDIFLLPLNMTDDKLENHIYNEI